MKEETPKTKDASERTNEAAEAGSQHLSDGVEPHKTSPKFIDTPTQPASGTDLESLISQTEDSEGVKVCRSCLLPPEDNETDYCGKCGEKLVTIKKAKDPYIETVVGEKYRVMKKIGQGGMGEVYLAQNDSLGQKVAIKFLIKRFADDENIVLRFLNEARSYCRVAHPNAVTLLEFGQHDDTGALYIITEFIEGMSITDTLKDSGLMSLEQAIDIGIQIAEVLSSAHEQGVIHRDLKPDNIMLTPSKRGRFVVKVLDFGIAKIIDDDEGPATETGSVFGTPEFMSPEQARGSKVDGRADIYAFGIILCFLLTGKLPFKGENKLSVLNQQLNSPPPRLASLRPNMTFSKGMETIIMKCLEKNPEHRFQDAEAVLEALESLRIDDGAFLTSLAASMTSSEFSEVELEEFKMETVRLGGEVENPTQLDSPFNDQHVNADLHSIEMWREAPTHPPTESGKSISLLFWAAVLATVVVAVVALSYLLGGDESNEFDVVFNEGQALGVVSVAEDLLADGKISDVRAALKKAQDWESTPKTQARIAELNLSAEKASTLYSKFKKDPCGPLTNLAEIQKISSGLAKRANRLKSRKCKKLQPKIIEKKPGIVIEKKTKVVEKVVEKKPDPVEKKTETVKKKVEKDPKPAKKVDPPTKKIEEKNPEKEIKKEVEGLPPKVL